MADGMLRTVRLLMRVIPAPARERLALRFFLVTRRHDEPERERRYRTKGERILAGGCEATTFGPPDAPVAVMTHGWSGRGLQLCAFVDPLVDAGFRVVAMDGPASGRNDGSWSSIPHWVAAIRQAIRELHPAAIIGHSFGSLCSILALDEERSTADMLCLGGPADPMNIIDRYRRFVRAPERGTTRFRRLLQQRIGATPEDVDVPSAAARLRGRLHCVVTVDDEDVPWQESVRIIEDAGGTSTVLEGITHRQVMWKPEAVDAGMAFLTERGG